MKKVKIEELMESPVVLHNEVEILRYLPIGEKIGVVTSVYEAMKRIVKPEHKKTIGKIVLDVEIVKAYTNLEIPGEYFEAYDLLVSTGALGFVHSGMSEDELKAIYNIYDNYAPVVSESMKNMEAFATHFIDNLVEKMGSAVGEAVTALGNLDPEKLTYVNEFMKVNRGE